MIHNLKTWPEFFRVIRSGTKKFEIRKNDRGFKVGDMLRLEEYSPETGYTGAVIIATVSYMIQGEWGLPEDLCVMSLVIPASDD